MRVAEKQQSKMVTTLDVSNTQAKGVVSKEEMMLYEKMGAA